MHSCVIIQNLCSWMVWSSLVTHWKTILKVKGLKSNYNVDKSSYLILLQLVLWATKNCATYFFLFSFFYNHGFCFGVCQCNFIWPLNWLWSLPFIYQKDTFMTTQVKYRGYWNFLWQSTIYMPGGRLYKNPWLFLLEFCLDISQTDCRQWSWLIPLARL